MKFGAIITAGGTSSRFGNTNKLLEKSTTKKLFNTLLKLFSNLILKIL